uniref:Putative secreted protein n=1 Tax=Anopheles triannulatus TaxID=58253 RepID=A0A2M4B5W8_9DIPT
MMMLLTVVMMMMEYGIASVGRCCTRPTTLDQPGRVVEHLLAVVWLVGGWAHTGHLNPRGQATHARAQTRFCPFATPPEPEISGGGAPCPFAS